MKYIHFSEEDVPLLVMEYLKYGNLLLQHHRKALDPSEIAAVLFQSLKALRYLHIRAEPVTHRDIKPENIIFKQREPRVHVKLADFGLATEGTFAGGVCGSWMYIAPEVFEGRHIYNAAVDIWSLGVVIFQCLSNFDLKIPETGLRQGKSWCEDIVKSVQRTYNANKTIPFTARKLDHRIRMLLYEFVIAHMLKMDPNERLSAEGCLEAGQKHSLFSRWAIPSAKGMVHRLSFTNNKSADGATEPWNADDFDSDESGTVTPHQFKPYGENHLLDPHCLFKFFKDASAGGEGKDPGRIGDWVNQKSVSEFSSVHARSVSFDDSPTKRFKYRIPKIFQDPPPADPSRFVDLLAGPLQAGPS